jgi:hypothetical protein
MLVSPKDQSPSGRPIQDDRKLPSNPEEVENLRRDSAANPLIAFTFDELKLITENFRQDHLLGGGGFGSVYKGIIAKDSREELQPLQVAVKVHDGDNSYQGHREWLVIFCALTTFIPVEYQVIDIETPFLHFLSLHLYGKLHILQKID